MTLVLNASLNLATSDNGTVSVSKPLQINGTSLIIVSIENYTVDFIEGLAIDVESTIPLSAIVADSGIQLSEPKAPYSANTRLLTITQIPPRRVTRLFISVPPGRSVTPPRIVNATSLGIRVRHENELESPFKYALMTAFFVALAYAAFTAVAATHLRRRLDSLKKDVAMLKDELDRKVKGNEEIRASMDMMKSRIAKQRLLLLARISDYARELEFWRSTITKLILAKEGDLRTSKDVISTVTETLGTHGTKAFSKDYESIRVAATWLAESERERENSSARQAGTSSGTQP